MFFQQYPYKYLFGLLDNINLCGNFLLINSLLTVHVRTWIDCTLKVALFRLFFAECDQVRKKYGMWSYKFWLLLPITFTVQYKILAGQNFGDFIRGRI